MRTRIALLLTLISVPALLLAAEHTKDSLETVKKATAAKTAVLVDVREEAEWDEGHIVGATLFPLSDLKGAKADQIAKKLPNDKIIYTHCRSGARSLRAADLLQKQGYDVRALEPGYDDLIQAGFPGEAAKPNQK